MVLVEDAGRVVTKEQILERVWPDAVVEEGSVTNNISILRKVLGPDFEGDGPIATVARRGYRFVADVRLQNSEATIGVQAPLARTPGTYGRFLLALLLAAAVVSTIVFVLLRPRTLPFEHVRQEMLTSSGDISTAAISPDGRFVLTMVQKDNKQGLSLLNVATRSYVPVLPMSDLLLQEIAFSGDGNFIYFRRQIDHGNDMNGLYRVPVLGGAVVPIVADIDTRPAFSPDEKHFAFVRWNYPKKDQNSLMVANADGTSPHVLSPLPVPCTYPAWSPDGKVIALTRPRGDDTGIDVVDAASGAYQRFYRSKSAIRSPSWLPDSKGLLFRFDDPDELRRQIGYVAYPSAEMRRVTSDTSHYNSALSLTADAKSLVTTIQRKSYIASVVPLDGAGVRRIASDSAIHGISWTRDGGLLLSVEGRLMRVSPGGESETLIAENDFQVRNPRPCGDGSIVFSGGLPGQDGHTFHSDAQGRDRRAVGGDGVFPYCSPDGRSIVYVDSAIHLMEVGAGANAPRDLHITAGYQRAFAVSSDFTKLVARMFFVGPPTPGVWRVFNLANGAIVRDLPVLDPLRVPVAFTPDGAAIASVVRTNGIDNIHIQPLDGSAAHVTAFDDPDPIADFSFSQDGKSLGLIREHLTSDVVLIRDVRQ